MQQHETADDQRWARAVALVHVAVENDCDLTSAGTFTTYGTTPPSHANEPPSTDGGASSLVSSSPADEDQLKEPPTVGSPGADSGFWLGSHNFTLQGTKTLAQQLAAATLTSSSQLLCPGQVALPQQQSCPVPPVPSPTMLIPSSVMSAARPQKKLLMLLDMNGTILVRSKRRIGKRPPDATLYDVHYYLRDKAISFVESLTQNNSIVFAFYTSMKETSARPATSVLCKGRSVELYERKFNKFDPEGENHWDTMRDLKKIWTTPDRVGFGFDETSTVVIEDTARKMREHPYNVIVVPSYTEESVLEGYDSVLTRLGDFLHSLFRANVDDVREFLLCNPFHIEKDTDDYNAVTRSPEAHPANPLGNDVDNASPGIQNPRTQTAKLSGKKMQQQRSKKNAKPSPNYMSSKEIRQKPSPKPRAAQDSQKRHGP